MYEIYDETGRVKREGEPSSSIREELAAMEKVNTQRGLAVLGSLLFVICWLFTVPPDIRRADVCPPGSSGQNCVTLAALGERVSAHYATCGRDGATAPCVAFDFSVDPDKKAAVAALVDAVVDAQSAGPDDEAPRREAQEPTQELLYAKPVR